MPRALRQRRGSRHRITAWWAALACLLCLYSVTAAAVPPPVVLVLKLVTKDFVRPTTGVVLAPDGLVLVPAGFVAAGDEIVVLDGGTDIVRNGRPAKPVYRNAGLGLALLEVQGLSRPGVAVTSDSPGANQAVQYVAFPPANQLADGAAPLQKQARLQANAENELGFQPALPNVTGPLFNGCGQLAGYNLAQGTPGDTDAKPLTLLADSLAAKLTEMQVRFQKAPCGAAAKPAPASDTESAPPPPAAKTSAPETTDQEEPKSPGPDPQAAEPQTPAEQQQTPEHANPESPETGTDGATQSMTEPVAQPGGGWQPLYIVLLIVAAAAVLAAGLRYALRVTKDTDAPATPRAEPDTRALSQSTPAGADDAEPDFDPMPESAAPLLVLEGRRGGRGPEFRRYVALDADACAWVIGRDAATCDIVLEHPAVSRRHARLGWANQRLSISDLGSSNGSRIDGLPCLPGEVLFVESGQQITLGEVRFSVRPVDGGEDRS